MPDSSYKPYRKALESADSIVKEVTEYKIAEPWTLTFKACCIFFFMARTGTNRYNTIVFAFRNKIKWQEVQRFVYNWKRHKRYDRGIFYMDYDPENHIANVIELTLLCMLAADEVECIKVV